MSYDSQCFFQFLWTSGLAAGGRKTGGQPGRRRCGDGGPWLVLRGRGWSELGPAGDRALLAPRLPSHWLRSTESQHLPAPRPEVSKVNEKFHP